MSRLSLPFEVWPDLDREAWLAAVTRGSLFEPGGRAARWAPATAKEVHKNYARWLGFLAAEGSLGAATNPAARVAEKTVSAYIGAMQARQLSPVTVTTRVRALREAIRVMDPTADLTMLSDAVAALIVNAHPTRNKAARLLHPRDMSKTIIDYLKEIPSLPCTEAHIRATWYRDAVAMLFLVWRPIRLKNLTMMRIDHHLRFDHGGWRCEFAADEMKDGISLSFSLPEVVITHIKVYLERYRPILLGHNSSSALWISKRRTPMAQQSLYLNITNLAEKLFGKHITPHIFRDCAATALAEDDPEHVLAIARILGHATMNTSNKHYNHAQMTKALDLLHSTLSDLKSMEP
jgi:site-specific recombinase XerD